MFLLSIQSDAIGTRYIQSQTIQLPIGPQPKYSTGRIGDSGLSLIGEIQIAISRKMQII
jgi:hypothetical protein